MLNSELPRSQAAHLKIGQQQNIFSTKLTNETKKKKIINSWKGISTEKPIN